VISLSGTEWVRTHLQESTMFCYQSYRQEIDAASTTRGEKHQAILHICGVAWQSAHEPKENHVDRHTDPGDDSGDDTSLPHRVGPPVVRNDNIRTRATSEDARVAVAVVEEIRELETGYQDQSYHVHQGEQEADPAEGYCDESREESDDAGSRPTSFRDAGEDC
jgi:hypothetical protein